MMPTFLDNGSQVVDQALIDDVVEMESKLRPIDRIVEVLRLFARDFEVPEAIICTPFAEPEARPGSISQRGKAAASARGWHAAGRSI